MESLCCPSLKETPKYVKHIELGFISHFETSVRDKTFLVQEESGYGDIFYL